MLKIGQTIEFETMGKNGKKTIRIKIVSLQGSGFRFINIINEGVSHKGGWISTGMKEGRDYKVIEAMP